MKELAKLRKIIDRELPDARKIYGQAMERIPSIGWFADAVSRLLCRQLRQG